MERNEVVMMSTPGDLSRRHALGPRRLLSKVVLGEEEIVGSVLDRDDLLRRFVVELRLDGHPVRLARADLFDSDLQAHGDGCYGFVFSLGRDLPDAHVAEIVIANTYERVGELLDLGVPDPPRALRAGVRWDGGLRLTGWVDALEPFRPDPVHAIIDGRDVVETDDFGWGHRASGSEAVPTRTFSLRLPPAFADGRVRSVRVVGVDGVDLPGSPCAVVAFDDRLETALEQAGVLASERLRIDRHRHLFPAEVPFSAWAAWRARFPLAEPAPAPGTIAVVLIGEDGTNETIASLEAQRGCRWVAAVLPNRDAPGTFHDADLAEFLGGDAAAAETVVFVLNGTAFEPVALVSLAAGLSAYPDAASSFSDLEIAAEDGTVWPLFQTAFDRERTLEQGCGAFLFAARRSAVENVRLGDVFSVFLQTAVRQGAGQAPVHVPGCLGRLQLPEPATMSPILHEAVRGHLARDGVAASIEPRRSTLLPAVRIVRTTARRSVSIVVPMCSRIEVLGAIAATVANASRLHRVELVLVFPGERHEVHPLTSDLPACRSIAVESPANASQFINVGARAAAGDLFLVLAPGTEPLGVHWLDAMVQRLEPADVGAVGPLLVERNGAIRSGGMVAGPGFAAVSCFADRRVGDGGYADLLVVAHECSALPLDGLLTRRDPFVESGGLDAVLFSPGNAAIDYGLQLRSNGGRIVFTPDTRMVCATSSGLYPLSTEASSPLALRERTALRARWGAALVDDPFYHPMLSREGTPYAGLAWPPAQVAPRQPVAGRPAAVPRGF